MSRCADETHRGCVLTRRSPLLAFSSLAASLSKRSYAQGPAMHVILLGDSVFDNGAYIGRDPDVRQQVEQISSQGLKATLRARDGAVISEVGNQLRALPSDATHLIISVGGNDALREAGVLDAAALSVADALSKLAAVGDRFSREYGSMLNEVLRVALPAAVCTMYEPRFPEASGIASNCVT